MKHDDTTSKAPHTRTTGDAVFDAATYIGIGGVVNAAFSMAFSDWVHNHWPKLPQSEQAASPAKKVYDFIYNSGEALSKPLEPFLGKNNIITHTNGAKEFQGAIKYSRRFMQGAVLGAGGWAMLPLIKAMEDHKPAIVDYINGTSTTPESTRRVTTDDTKQSWTSLLGGRTFAFLTPLLVAAPILEVYQKKTGHDIFESISDFSRDTLHIKPENFVKNMQVTRGKEISYQLAGEAFYTVIGVTVLYTISKLISQTLEQSTPKPSEKPTPAVFQVAQHKPMLAAPATQAHL